MKGTLLLANGLIFGALSMAAACGSEGLIETGQTSPTSLTSAPESSTTSTRSAPTSSTAPTTSPGSRPSCMFGPLAFDVPRGFSYNIETDSRYPSCAGMMLTEAAPGSSRLAPAPEVFRIADYFGKLDLEPNPFPVVVSYSGTSVSKTSAEVVSLRLSSILALAKSDSKVTVESGKVTISPPTPVLVVRAAAKTLGPGTYLLRLTYTALNDAGANISGLESLYVVLSNGSTLEIGVTEYRDGLTHERAASLLDEIAANIRLT